MYRYLFASLVLVPLAGCVSSGVRDFEVTPSQTLDTQIGSRLTLLLPSGNFVVEQSPDEQLHASVRFFCNADSETCQKNAMEAGIRHTQQGEQSTLSFKPSSAYSSRYADLRFLIRVPEVENLSIEMDAGALKIDSATACINVKAGAGEVSIRAPAASAASVSLDANIGDSSLRTPSGDVYDERKLLVGSEVQWDEGSGRCQLRGKLQAGNLDVELVAAPTSP
ncbi:MAG: hypothetical protein ACI8RN_000990 [Glaciecola sp.]|jgi:hypothetical protein|uniref:hypothetical protein n=1 Tax=Congregibacter sp. TaxID=2744308 RepID=UPI0039E42B61